MDGEIMRYSTWERKQCSLAVPGYMSNQCLRLHESESIPIRGWRWNWYDKGDIDRESPWSYKPSFFFRVGFWSSALQSKGYAELEGTTSTWFSPNRASSPLYTLALLGEWQLTIQRHTRHLLKTCASASDPSSRMVRSRWSRQVTWSTNSWLQQQKNCSTWECWCIEDKTPWHVRRSMEFVQLKYRGRG